MVLDKTSTTLLLKTHIIIFTRRPLDDSSSGMEKFPQLKLSTVL